MAENFKDKERAKSADDEARRELAKNWAQVTASMVSPDAEREVARRDNGQRAKRNGSSLSSLPVPNDTFVDEKPAAAPVDESKLSPAQRARMGLDSAPAEERQRPPSPPPSSPAPREPAAQAQPPPLPEPRLAPVSQPVAPADRQRGDPAAPRERVQPASAPAASAQAAAPQRARSEETYEHVRRDRNVLSYGFAWTAFAFVVAAAIAFTNSMSGDSTTAAGPGPMMPTLISIGIGWSVVLASRALGKYWYTLMILPALVLFIGPYAYHGYWANGVETSARSYLSNMGTDVLIDIDNTSIISETVNSERGCFAITRERATKTTVVSVVTYASDTARQQADFSMAPRFAGRIEVGGERSSHRQFTFQNGLAPPTVTTPEVAPLDCEHSTSAPGTGAGISEANQPEE
jgi:hypothetical protein